MKLKLLITRPIEDAVEMSKLFNSKKILPIISPMIKIRKEAYNCTIKPDIIIFTSKNGVRNFDFSVDKNSKTKVLTLGEETRKLAREKGLENIKSVNGDTNSLIIELEKVIVIEDRLQAIKTAYTLAKSKDIILIAGKGHEKYQQLKNEKIEFDDFKELKLLLKEK